MGPLFATSSPVIYLFIYLFNEQSKTEKFRVSGKILLQLLMDPKFLFLCLKNFGEVLNTPDCVPRSPPIIASGSYALKWRVYDVIFGPLRCVLFPSLCRVVSVLHYIFIIVLLQPAAVHLPAQNPRSHAVRVRSNKTVGWARKQNV